MRKDAVNKENLYAAILVGGSGTRFWPKSRQKKPKQFLNITGDGTLFEKTLKRVKQRVDPSRVFIVTNALYKKEVMNQISKFQIPRANVLLEPEAKNTAPAVCWASMCIHKINPQATIMVLPSDHLILNQKKYEKVLGRAIQLAQGDCLVTLGIVPTRPETGYGYLKTKPVNFSGREQLKVEAFIEKPNAAKAKQFMKRKNYFWNSGMFIWRSEIILQEFQKHLPRMYACFSAGISQKRIGPLWKKIQAISVDYGILEKSSRVMAVKAEGILWSDLGSWESLADFLKKDKDQNIFKGDIVPLDCSDSFIWGQNKLIAAIGLKGLIIVDTPDALLVCRKDKSQEVRQILHHLKKNNKPQA